MDKAKKHGFWFYFGRVMAGIGIALLLLVLYVYLSVPTYSFKETKPFSGEYLYNPTGLIMSRSASRRPNRCQAFRSAGRRPRQKR